MTCVSLLYNICRRQYYHLFKNPVDFHCLSLLSYHQIYSDMMMASIFYSEKNNSGMSAWPNVGA